jgi:uncharacterized protein (DUF2249 family)
MSAEAPANEVDVRAIPHRHRHAEIFSRLDRLPPDETVVVVSDHDPLPLRFQIDALWKGTFDWSYAEEGPEVWRVRIRRVRAEA